MTIIQLQALLAVIDQGGFVRAADSMALSQSGVSRAVASLERELGIKLFHRRAFGSVAVTAVGERVAELARVVVAAAMAIEAEANGLRAMKRDKLRVAAVPSAALRLLPDLVDRFSMAYPGIDVVCLEGADDEIRSWLGSGVADVGLLALPIEGLEAVPLIEDEFVALLPQGHPLASRERVSPIDLVPSTLVMSKSTCTRWLRTTLDSAEDLIRVVEVSDPATSYQIVREGLGVSIIPTLALPSDLEGVIVRSFDPPQTRQIAVAWRHSAAQRHGSTAFIDYCRRGLTAPSSGYRGASTGRRLATI